VTTFTPFLLRFLPQDQAFRSQLDSSLSALLLPLITNRLLCSITPPCDFFFRPLSFVSGFPAPRRRPFTVLSGLTRIWFKSFVLIYSFPLPLSWDRDTLLRSVFSQDPDWTHLIFDFSPSPKAAFPNGLSCNRSVPRRHNIPFSPLNLHLTIIGRSVWRLPLISYLPLLVMFFFLTLSCDLLLPCSIALRFSQSV